MQEKLISGKITCKGYIGDAIVVFKHRVVSGGGLQSLKGHMNAWSIIGKKRCQRDAINDVMEIGNTTMFTRWNTQPPCSCTELSLDHLMGVAGIIQMLRCDCITAI